MSVSSFQNEAAQLAEELQKLTPEFCYDFEHIKSLPPTQTLLSSPPEVQIGFVRRCCELIAALHE